MQSIRIVDLFTYVTLLTLGYMFSFTYCFFFFITVVHHNSLKVGKFYSTIFLYHDNVNLLYNYAIETIQIFH